MFFFVGLMHGASTAGLMEAARRQKLGLAGHGGDH